jgi:hypothetical protein
MTIHNFSNSYYIKKGTFTYGDSNPGDSRSQKMWRYCSQIASDYMKFYINPLRLVSVPPPPPLPLIPAPPLLSQARSLIATLITLTRGIQGCSATASVSYPSSLRNSFPNGNQGHPWFTPAAESHTVPSRVKQCPTRLQIY